MKIRLLLTILVLASAFTSCTRLYSPALYHNDIVYQPKPTSFDTEKAATYISGGLSAHSSPSFSDFLVSGQVNLSQGFVFDNFNFAYGGFAAFGNYQRGGSVDSNNPNYFRDKFFGAVGGRASVNAFVHSDRADFRFIGVEAAFSHEFGDYLNYRRSVENVNGYYVDPRQDLFTIGLTTEVIFHNRDNKQFQHGIRGFLGTTVGHNNLNDTYYINSNATERMFRSIFPKASYYLKYNKFFGTFEVGSAVFLRAGYQF